MSTPAAPTAAVPVTWVCQEKFLPNNTTSCMRYPKIKRCVKEGLASGQTFLCVDHDSISVGGSGPTPLPEGIVPFLCSVDSCPQEAPAKPKSEMKKDKETSNTTNAAACHDSVRWSGVFVLAMVMVPMVLSI
ncbi:hypothetical protein BGZ94_002537 [Podila epigama]|nr:hypothetical protein BGZ94_002537 [Podila epigama]